MRHLRANPLARLVAGTLAIAGGLAGVLVLIARIRDGHGLDHYIAVSGQEWSAIPALVFVVVGTMVLVVGGGLSWWRNRRQRASRSTRARHGWHGHR